MAKGKRAGARPKRRWRRDALLLAGGATLAVLAWGYLVWAAIDFGSDARGGDGRAWGFLALAAVGAMACLFVGLLLGSRMLHALATSAPTVIRNELTSPVPGPTEGSTHGSGAGMQSAHRHRAD